MLARRDGHKEIYHKADLSPVTAVDLEISRLVCQRVSEQFPGYGLLTEETFSGRMVPFERGFVIDELDGTHSYMLGRREFSFQAAYYEEGRLVAGVIFSPMRELMLYAARGQGVFMQTVSQISRILPPSYRAWSRLRFAHHRNHMTETQRRVYVRLGVPASRIIHTGCISSKTIDFVLGKVDALVALNRFIGPWDWAPGKVILEELGFRLTHLDGSELRLFATPAEGMSFGYLVCQQAHHERLYSELQWINHRLRRYRAVFMSA